MTTHEPLLTDALLKDALDQRSSGTRTSVELVDEVRTAIDVMPQSRGWTLRFAPAGVPLAATVLLVTTIIGLAFVVGGAVPTPGGAVPTPGGAVPTPGGAVPSPTDGTFVAPFLGLPPEGAELSTPETGELVVSDSRIHPWYSVNVYADGRMIWAQERGAPFSDGANRVTGWTEQRLTAEGIELLRSGAVVLGGQYEPPGSRLPASAWSDSRMRGYVPARYAVCYWYLDDDRSDPANILRTIPDEARALLSDETYDRYLGGRPDHIRCHDVATAVARRLDEILIGEGIERRVSFNWVEYPLAQWDDRRAGAPEAQGYGVPDGTPIIWISPLLPHGEWSWAGG